MRWSDRLLSHRWPQAPTLGVEWVQARLQHDALTRHLRVTVRRSGTTLILEGRVPTWLDRQQAAQVASRAYTAGPVDNRLEIAQDQHGSPSGGPLPLAMPRWTPPAMAAA